MTLRIKITKERAEAILARLPGGRELYMRLASEFIEEYESPSRQSDEEDKPQATGSRGEKA